MQSNKATIKCNRQLSHVQRVCYRQLHPDTHTLCVYLYTYLYIYTHMYIYEYISIHMYADKHVHQKLCIHLQPETESRSKIIRICKPLQNKPNDAK